VTVTVVPTKAMTITMVMTLRATRSETTFNLVREGSMKMEIHFQRKLLIIFREEMFISQRRLLMKHWGRIGSSIM
jgi:hypothetical protein